MFDGDGHVVGGMFVSATGPDNGLFGNVSGTVRNVTVENSWVRGGKNTGVVVGYNIGTVENVTNRGSVVGTEDCTGGVVGYSDWKSIPLKTYSSAMKDLINEGVVHGKQGAGGVAGCAVHASASGLKNTAAIEGNNFVGGVIGKIGSSDENDFRDMTNSGRTAGVNFVGGIAGACGNASNARGNARPAAGCYESGAISFSRCEKFVRAANSGRVEGENYVGGVLGAACQANAGELGNSGQVGGKSIVSGVIGYIGFSTTAALYNVGDVSGNEYIGGVFAQSEEGVVSAAYSAGEVAGDSLSGLMVGYSYNTTVADYYYLERGDHAPFGQNNGGGEATAKTEAEMKSAAFVGLLGDAFVLDPARNGSYPVLAWETD